MIAKLFATLTGMKTYLVAGCGIAYALIHFFIVGDFDQKTTVAFILGSGGLGALRHGVSTQAAVLLRLALPELLDGAKAKMQAAGQNAGRAAKMLLVGFVAASMLSGCSFLQSLTSSTPGASTTAAASTSPLDAALAKASQPVQFSWWLVEAADAGFQAYAQAKKLDPALVADEQKAFASAQALMSNPATTESQLVANLTATYKAIVAKTPTPAASN